MPNLYSNIDKSSWVYAPNFGRSRAKYRGVRESYKFNTEIYQILYDFRKLYEKFDSLDTVFSLNLNTIENGSTLSATYVWRNVAESPMTLPGVNDLALRISQLKHRVLVLEGV
jgi:hypothetical protein